MPYRRAALLLLAGLTLLSTAAEAQVEITFGHIGERESLFDRSAQEFARRANARLRGRAKVMLYGASQLGSDLELMKKLKLGTVDLALPSTVMSSQVPIFGLFEMPYLVRSREHMARIRDQIVMPLRCWAAQAQRVIMYWRTFGFDATRPL